MQIISRCTLSKRTSMLCLLVAVLCPHFAPDLSAQIHRYDVVVPMTMLTGTYSGDRDIAVASFFSDGRIETPPNKPKFVCSQSYKEFDPVAVSDRFGGMFLAYTIEHTDEAHHGDRDILMRRLDAQQNDLWGDSTNHVVPIAQSNYIETNPTIVQQPDGSMFVLYEVHYSKGVDSGDVDVAAVAINRDGTMLWSGGSWVANSKKRERIAGAVSDGRGGAIVVIEVSTYGDSTIVNSDIIAVHIDKTGKTGWGAASSEPIAIAASRHFERNPAIVSDGFGGLYVAYEIEYVVGDRVGDIDILAQHISAVGAREWIDETAPPIVSSNSKAKEYKPAIFLDNSGLTIAFKIELLAEKKPGGLIGIQKMDLTGHALWNEGRNASLVAVAQGESRRPQITSDGFGGAYLLLEVRDTLSGDRDIYAQRIGHDGNVLWSDGEFAIPILSSPDPERDASMVVEPDGSMIVVAVRDLHDSTTGRTTSNVLAQKVRLDGKNAWPDIAAPITISRTEAYVQRPRLVAAY